MCNETTMRRSSQCYKTMGGLVTLLCNGELPTLNALEFSKLKKSHL